MTVLEGPPTPHKLARHMRGVWDILMARRELWKLWAREKVYQEANLTEIASSKVSASCGQ